MKRTLNTWAILIWISLMGACQQVKHDALENGFGILHQGGGFDSGVGNQKLYYEDAAKNKVIIWPYLLAGYGQVSITNNVALFCGAASNARPSHAVPRLFIVQAPGKATDITDEILAAEALRLNQNYEIWKNLYSLLKYSTSYDRIEVVYMKSDSKLPGDDTLKVVMEWSTLLAITGKVRTVGRELEFDGVKYYKKN